MFIKNYNHLKMNIQYNILFQKYIEEIIEMCKKINKLIDDNNLHMNFPKDAIIIKKILEEKEKTNDETVDYLNKTHQKILYYIYILVQVVY